MPVPAAAPGAATVPAAGPPAGSITRAATVRATARAATARAATARAGALVLAGAIALAGGAALAGCATSASANGAAHVATVPLAGRQQARLNIRSGATSITVATRRLGGDLLRVSTPAGAGLRPALTAGGTELYLHSTGSAGPAAVLVTLNSGVAWRLTFSGGSTRTSLFLGRGQLSGADFAAGSSQITMRLPRPRGTVTILLAGGASQVRLATPAGVPALLRLDGGGGTATVGGRAYAGLAGGTVLTEPGWAGAANRYNIEAPAGVASITVGHW